MASFPQQLPLAVQLPDDELFSTYHEGANSEALHWLQSVAGTPQERTVGERLTWLCGPKASGKSHLLHATVALATANKQQVIYLPLAEFEQIEEPRALLDGLEQFDLICLDDIDSVLSSPEWCFQLFGLINQVTDSATSRLVMTAKQPAKQVTTALADLHSRLQWATGYQLSVLTDDDKANALSLRANWRGLQLPADVAQFMLHRLGRDMAQLMRCLNELDKASIAQQRRLTIPFVKQILSV